MDIKLIEAILNKLPEWVKAIKPLRKIVLFAVWLLCFPLSFYSETQKQLANILKNKSDKEKSRKDFFENQANADTAEIKACQIRKKLLEEKMLLRQTEELAKRQDLILNEANCDKWLEKSDNLIDEAIIETNRKRA